MDTETYNLLLSLFTLFAGLILGFILGYTIKALFQNQEHINGLEEIDVWLEEAKEFRKEAKEYLDECKELLEKMKDGA